MNRTVVITGGSRGIGLATARQLLELGHHVIVTGRNSESLDEAVRSLSALGSITGLAFDSSDHYTARDLLEGTGADILVCNVGMGFSGSITTTTIDEWHQVMDTNVTSAFSAISAVLPGMLAYGWGRIVCVGSIASHQAIRYGTAYTASKHALLGLTRAVAEDTRNTGILANMVAPAFVRTDMTLENTRRIAQARGGTQEDAEARLGALSTLGRLIEPEEVAEQIVKLTAEELTATGTSVTMGFDES
jgi:NAD(P)-dependent dehydrogenase (short-subunit alcohol dehydrogenase family)